MLYLYVIVKMGNKTFKSASNGRQHQVSETISEDEYVRQEEEEDVAAEFDLVASLLDRNMDHAVLEILNNLVPPPVSVPDAFPKRSGGFFSFWLPRTFRPC